MIVDDRNPEVSATLAAWFHKRDELADLRSTDEIPTLAQQADITDAMDELVEIGDELINYFCPRGREDRIKHTGESL